MLCGLVGIVFWNLPGIKSRRLGRECKDVLELVSSAESRDRFENARDVCYTNVAREYQNTQLCDWIEQEEMNSLCYVHVYYWEKTVEFCENDEQKDICLHVVSIRNKDKSICNMIRNPSLRMICLKG